MGTENGVYKSHVRAYIYVFIALAVLTVLELIIPEMHLQYVWHASLLTGLALIKAVLVGYFYMHLNEETSWLKFIALIPISAFIYAAVVTIESIGR